MLYTGSGKILKEYTSATVLLKLRTLKLYSKRWYCDTSEWTVNILGIYGSAFLLSRSAKKGCCCSFVNLRPKPNKPSITSPCMGTMTRSRANGRERPAGAWRDEPIRWRPSWPCAWRCVGRRRRPSSGGSSSP